MPNLYDIEQARTAATSAQARYGELAAGEPSVADIIKQKAIEAYGASQDIIKPLDVATQGYLTAPQVAREKYQDIFNPFARERLVAQYTGNQALPMLSLGSILGQRFGRIEDIIGAGTRAYQGQTLAAQSAAQQQRQLYSDLLGEYQLTRPQNQWLDLGTTKALVDEQGNIVSQLPITKTGEGEGGISDIIDQLLLGSILGGGGAGTTPSTYEPAYTPREGEGARQGQWIFHNGEWMINTEAFS